MSHLSAYARRAAVAAALLLTAGCAAAPATPRAPSGACPTASLAGFCVWPEGLTPAESPVYVYNEATIPAPPEVVWRHLTRADRWSTWFPRAKNVRIEAGGPELTAGSVVVWEMLGATIRVTVRQADAPRLLAWEGGAAGVHAYHAWMLLPSGQGTRVITVETERGVVPALLAPYLRGALHDAHADWLRGLSEVAGR